MQVIRTVSEGLKQQFKVVIPALQISGQLDSRLNEMGRTARVPGFRPGKVPMGILRKKYGPSVIGEVVEDAVNDGARKAIADHDLRPALRPEIAITAYREGGDLEFTVQVEVLPEVVVGDLSGLQLERPVAEVADDAVEQALTRIAQNRETTVPADDSHPAVMGDVVEIDFEGSVDGVPFDGGKADNYPLKLGSNSLIPGFEDQLVGVKAGEHRIVSVSFPDEYGAANLAGKAAQFAVTVKQVKTVQPAAVDEALAQSLGLADLEALRQSVKAEIAKDYAQMSRAHVKRRLLDKLSDGYSFEVPAGMVSLEFDAIWKQVEDDRKAGREDPSDQGKSDEELKTEYRAIAERRVRLGLLLSEVGRRNNISITQDDLNRAVIAEARNYPGQEQMVLQYYQKNADAKEALRAPIYEEKVVDFILELATVTERPVSVEMLRADPDEILADATPATAEAKPKAKAKAKAKTTEPEQSAAPEPSAVPEPAAAQPAANKATRKKTAAADSAETKGQSEP